ncbi:hypothetical protein DV736_g1095, partial [Chaetothyriales sp. CBS 134916]
MASSLNVIALISGGKDSLYSILHCFQNGHKVIALANLRPPPEPGHGSGQEESGDLDSMMYQTVGHQVIPLYAEALGLPLYRQIIRGTAAQTGRDYDSSDWATVSAGDDDEVEDLFALLQDVKKRHPTANALCSGAILSTYQRTRVESVALRLGLTPLAYLWQYPSLPPPQSDQKDGTTEDGRPDSLTGLLDDMAATACDSRIIKTASAGIPEHMLWSNVADPRTRTQLVSSLARFYPDQEAGLRSAVLGEGGEYETVAICGPPAVWKKRIEIDPDRIKTISEPGGASYALIPPATLVPNNPVNTATSIEDIVRRPSMFDAQFRRLLDDDQPVRLPTDLAEGRTKQASVLLEPLSHADTSMLTHGAHIVLANQTAPDAGDDAESQVDGIYANLKAKLETQSVSASLTTSNIIFSLLLLSNMDDFATVNAAYARMFPTGQPNPAARVTVAVDSLPSKVRVSLSVIVDARNRKSREALHVQSRSYWAPANIGPYSQAVNEPLNSTLTSDGTQNFHRLPELIHLAGQIALVPHTMQLSDQSFRFHAILSLQHLWRVGQEREVDLWPWGVAFLATHEDACSRARVADWVWMEAHKGVELTQLAEGGEGQDEDADDYIDVWDRTFGKYASSKSATSVSAPAGWHLHSLPNLERLAQFSTQNISDLATEESTSDPTETTPPPRPPLVVVNVATLPLGAPIEWWSTGLAHLTAENVRIDISSTLTTYGAQHVTILTPTTTSSTDDHDRGSGYTKDNNTNRTDDLSGPIKTVFAAILISASTASSAPTPPTAQRIIDSAIHSVEHAAGSPVVILDGTAFITSHTSSSCLNINNIGIAMVHHQFR